MTLSEAEKRFTLPRSTLEEYITFGFIRKVAGQAEEIEPEYRDEDFERLGLVDTLLEAGFTPKETGRFLNLTETAGTGEEQIRMLRRQRRNLLDDIHKMQKILDGLDYQIWEIQKEEGGK